MPPCCVQILLSTWNGERWLPELLASLSRQTFRDWQLLVRDDGSTDQTLKILLDWQAANPDKVAGIIADGQNLGATRSFSLLAEISSAPYLMFCDQDDVWFPEKIERQYARLHHLQETHGETTPLLVHSDLVVVDQDKNLLSLSFQELRGFHVKQEKQAYLLDNVVTGCATAFNRAAAQLAFPAPLHAMQHDRWLALVCAWFGHIGTIPYPLVLYRQHGQNLLGAQPAGLPGIGLRAEAWSQQAEAFMLLFGDRLSARDYRLVEALANLQRLDGWQRRQHIVRHRLFKQRLLANLALLIFA